MSFPIRSSHRSIIGFMTVFLVASVLQGNEPERSATSQSTHWSFRPVTKPVVPASASEHGSSHLNSIDAFIGQKLSSVGHKLSRPADRQTLLRRVTFDLIGLPATPTEIVEFVKDDSPDAYERVIDRLLANPHFGEAWGRTWLDVVRFAETSGFKEDPLRPNAYTYRDYVIRAFNRDLPYDRFVCDQLAGDEMFPDNAESQAATAYCRMWPDESNASNIHLARQTSLDDLTANLGAAFLGLSIGCAQCHDHKFDPILQTDFYQLQAFFSGIVLEDDVPVGTHTQLTRYRQAESEWLAETANLRRELNKLERPARYKMQGERRLKFPSDVLEALDLPLEDRTTIQRQLAFWSARQMGVKEDDIPKYLDDSSSARREELLLLMADARLRRPKPDRDAAVMAVAELTQIPPTTFRMENGSYDKPKEELQPHIPTVLRRDAKESPPEVTPPNPRSSGRRTTLAQWLASSENPLTHRVWVNRIWQGHFGRGLVSNANDLGIQASTPDMLEMFNWFTSEFIAGGLEMKRVHRQIVLSATYRQASRLLTDDDETSAEQQSVGDAPVYAYFPRQRLTSERIRDAWLMSSGQLNDSLYGPGIRPELPPNFSSYEWKVSEPSQQVRRSVYLFAKRNLPYPLMVAFDFPDMHESCGCRSTTTIAPQALMLLNNRIVLEAAGKLAERSGQESTSADPVQRIERVWQLVFGRSITDREVETCLKFVDDQYRRIVDNSSQTPGESSQASEAAMTDLCHALFNTNEFLFVD